MRIKIITVVCILLLANIGSYSQSCEESYNKMKSFYKEGKIKEAITIGEKTLSICEKELGKESLNYAYVIDFLGILYAHESIFLKAELLYLESLKIIKKLLGPEDVEYATSLYHLGVLYDQQGKYSKAEHLYLECLAIRGKKLGLGSRDYATTLNALAGLYVMQGNYSKAAPLFIEALEIRKEIFGIENPDYATSLNNLAFLYYMEHNYSKAEPLFIEALEIRKKVLGKESPDYATTLFNLGELYYKKENYSKSETLYLEALKIRKKVLGTENLDYSTCLNSLGDLYDQVGNYSKAELLFTEALEIRKRVLGTDNPFYLTSLSNLGSFFNGQGNYSKAESLYLNVLEIQKKNSDTKKSDYASTLNSIGFIYINQEKYSKAEPFIEDALNIQRSISGIENQTYLSYLSNLAVLYERQGNYIKAAKVNNETLSTRKILLGDKHSDYALSLNNLASIYITQGNYIKAKPLILKALAIYKAVLGTGNTTYTKTLTNLVSLYKSMGNLEYLSNLSDLLFLNRKQIILQTSFQPTNELSVYLNINKLNYFDSKFSLAYPFNITNDTINYELYNTAILLKNLTLRNSTQVQNRIRESKDSALINTLEEFHKIRKQLNKYAALPKTEHADEIKNLENEADLLEKKLVIGSQALKENNNFNKTNWKDVQRALKKDEAAIEFVSFQYLSNKWTDSVIYAAMVIRPGYAYPKIIALFEEKQLGNLLIRNNSLPDENYLNALYSKDNFSLYNLIVKPIDSLLQGVNTIYTAPSGSLYNINLSQIMSNKPDGSTFYVHILGTTGELPRYSALQLNKSTISSEVVFGGVNYDSASNSGITFHPPTYTPGFGQVASVTNRGGANSWAYLPGTLTEAMEVGKISTQAGLKVTLLKGDEANETSFKNMNGFSSPYILHLATHGYFFPNPVQEKPRDFELMSTDKKTVYKWVEDPLLRSGLILAGANKAWKNSALITDSTEDGILTSMEVANVDLSSCKLAVLSACETGLGDINGSEGVFGLQRGFKLAGVKNIIMSLWKIPDTQSAELLTMFYQNCFSGLSVNESLKQAQLEMSTRYAAYYWAGFVLLE